jgi:hypothetical protein
MILFRRICSRSQILTKKFSFTFRQLVFKIKGCNISCCTNTKYICQKKFAKTTSTLTSKSRKTTKCFTRQQLILNLISNFAEDLNRDLILYLIYRALRNNFGKMARKMMLKFSQRLTPRNQNSKIISYNNFSNLTTKLMMKLSKNK